MRTRKLSPVTLFVGVVVGLAALHAGTAPFAGINKTVRGGFWERDVGGEVYVATNERGAECGSTCSGTTYQSCTNYDVPSGSCWGAYIDVATCHGAN